jgi:hypothetical protein
MKARWVAKNTTTGIANIPQQTLQQSRLQLGRRQYIRISSVRTITTTSLDTSADMATKGYPLANAGARTPYTSDIDEIHEDANQYIYVYISCYTNNKC